MLPPQLNLVIEIEFADATTALWSENAGAHPLLSTDFETQNVRVLALVESFNRVLLSGSCSATPRCTRSSPASRTAWRSTTMRAPKSTCWPTRGRTWPPSARQGRRTASADAAGQPAVPSQFYEGSLGALPLPLRPCGCLRRHGAQHRHRPRGLPAPQLHCRLDGTMTDLFIHLVAYQLVTLSGTGVFVLN